VVRRGSDAGSRPASSPPRCARRVPSGQARSIQDTSRQGRYHNRRYAQLAGELGLEVSSVKPIGWSATTVPEPTASSYAGQLEELQAALVLWRRQEHRIGTGTRSPQPARRRLPVRPAHPRRQGDPGRGAHRLRRLPAPLRASRLRPRQQLTLNRQPGRTNRAP